MKVVPSGVPYQEWRIILTVIRLGQQGQVCQNLTSRELPDNSEPHDYILPVPEQHGGMVQPGSVQGGVPRVVVPGLVLGG